MIAVSLGNPCIKWLGDQGYVASQKRECLVRSPFLWKTLPQEQWKVEGSRLWCLVRSPGHQKVVHRRIGIGAGSATAQISPTPAEERICSHNVDRLNLSWAISNQSLSIPRVLTSVTAKSLQRFLVPCLGRVLVNSPKSNCLGILKSSILQAIYIDIH